MSAPSDLVIIGAGPAGMAAAITAREAGLSVLVADEGPAPGGQIYRNVLGANEGSAGILGADYTVGRGLADRFLASGVEYYAQASVFMIERADDEGFLVGLALADGSTRLIEVRVVLIATGAQERPFPIPGWTLPGVMSAGAAQSLLKASGTVPSAPVILAGTGPLLMLLAAQYIRAGVEISALLETTPLANLPRALPHLPGFLLSNYSWKGMGLLRGVLRSTRIYWSVRALKAHGDKHLEEVHFSHRGDEKQLPATLLLLHQGVVPQVNLAMSVGARHQWNEQRLAFEPSLSPDHETSVPGLFVAGDGSGIDGAMAAEAGGTLAALAIIDRLGRKAPDHPTRLAQSRNAFGKARQGRRFLDALYQPAKGFRVPADDVIICRCEEVRAGEIRALALRGAQGPNQAKVFSRAGMGPCQGRSCSLTVTEIMADILQKSPGEIGHMRIRAPVKPVSVAQMARLVKT